MSLYRTRHHSGHPPRNEARDASPSVRSRDQVREARLLGRAHLVSGRPHGRVVLGCGSNRGASLLVPSRRRRSPAGTRWFAPHINGDPDRPVRHWNLLIPAGSERRMPLARLYAPSSVRRTPAVRDSIPYRDMKFICSIRPLSRRPALGTDGTRALGTGPYVVAPDSRAGSTGVGPTLGEVSNEFATDGVYTRFAPPTELAGSKPLAGGVDSAVDSYLRMSKPYPAISNRILHARAAGESAARMSSRRTMRASKMPAHTLDRPPLGPAGSAPTIRPGTRCYIRNGFEGPFDGA